MFPPEIRCEPGQVTDPTGHCERHGQHHYCRTCGGFYGVPHDDIHSGPQKHPNRFAHQCACRVCKDYVAALAASRGEGS